MRDEGFNVLFIPHARSTLDEVREAVQQITFDEHDDLIKGILDETIEGVLDIETHFNNNPGDLSKGGIRNRIKRFTQLFNAISSGDSLALLRWVGWYAPKFDTIILLMII